jgi:hypothetical protein
MRTQDIYVRIRLATWQCFRLCWVISTLMIRAATRHMYSLYQTSTGQGTSCVTSIIRADDQLTPKSRKVVSEQLGQSPAYFFSDYLIDWRKITDLVCFGFTVCNQICPSHQLIVSCWLSCIGRQPDRSSDNTWSGDAVTPQPGPCHIRTYTP